VGKKGEGKEKKMKEKWTRRDKSGANSSSKHYQANKGAEKGKV